MPRVTIDQDTFERLTACAGRLTQAGKTRVRRRQATALAVQALERELDTNGPDPVVRECAKIGDSLGKQVYALANMMATGELMPAVAAEYGIEVAGDFDCQGSEINATITDPARFLEMFGLKVSRAEGESR